MKGGKVDCVTAGDRGVSTSHLTSNPAKGSNLARGSVPRTEREAGGIEPNWNNLDCIQPYVALLKIDLPDHLEIKLSRKMRAAGDNLAPRRSSNPMVRVIFGSIIGTAAMF
jgi:hypothetical protein